MKALLLQIKGLLASNKLFFMLLVFFLFLRFWKIEQLFVFDLDEEYQALLGWSLVKDFHIIWIGVSASNIGYYLGPGLSYLTAFLLWISRGDPLILAYFAPFVGAITLISLYFISSQLFDKKIALIASIIYTFSTFIIYYDRKFWPIFVPLVALWLLYSLSKARQNTKWLILASILMGAAYHIHLSLLIFWPFLLFTIIQNWKKIKLWQWLGIVGSYLFITLPLLIFDFLHNFDNLTLPFRLLRGLTSSDLDTSGKSSFEFLNHLLRKTIYYQTGESIVTDWGIILLTVALLFFIKRFGTSNYSYRLLAGVIFLLSLAVLFYPGPLQEYYAVIFFPFVTVMIALVLCQLPNLAQIIMIGFFMVINLVSFNQYSQETEHGLENKKQFVQKVSNHLRDDYYLRTDGDYRNIAGWRYLFQAYGKPPAQSQADEIFGWIYHDEISGPPPKSKLIISRDKDLNIKAVQISQPPYYGYITDN